MSNNDATGPQADSTQTSPVALKVTPISGLSISWLSCKVSAQPSLSDEQRTTLHTGTSKEPHNTPPGTETDKAQDFDLEKSPRNDTVAPDPFRLREGVTSENELSQLRKMPRSGKKLERYHRKQNKVRGYAVPQTLAHDTSLAYR
jgi:hypothetical protein